MLNFEINYQARKNSVGLYLALGLEFSILVIINYSLNTTRYESV